MATWGDRVALHLIDSTLCPRCNGLLTVDRHCRTCGSDLSGDAGDAVRSASLRAANAMRERESLIQALPTIVPRAAAPARSLTSPVVPRERSSVSVQSVLAVAGAGLFAIAAVVFTFLNPDLTDFGTRTAIIGGITALFIAGAWLLARAHLGFSAEAVGALGAVFVVLDVWAFSQIAPAAQWWLAAAGTVVASGILLLLAHRTRVRAWVTAGIVGITLVPAFAGYALGAGWLIVLGHLVGGFVALALHGLVARFGLRFESPMRLERATLTGLQVLASLLVVAGLLGRFDDSLPLSALTLLALAVLCALAARHELPGLWAFGTGGFAAASAFVIALLAPVAPVWMVAVLPAAGSVVVIVLSAVPLPSWLNREIVQVGAWAPVLSLALPGAALALGQIMLPGFLITGTGTLAPIAGTAAVALGTAGMGLLSRGEPTGLRTGAVITALWFAALALVSFAQWTELAPATRTGILLALSLGATWLVARPLRAWTLARRAPLIALANGALLPAAVITYCADDTALVVAGGFAVGAALLVASRTASVAIRPLHVAASYAWTLGVVAHALALAGLEVLPVLCLTTTLASVVALVATLVRRLGVRAWYAILLVTAAPFLIGVGSVVAERSGWTALSTGVTFALAVTLTITSRPGLTRAVRALAAGLLVPSLAVVVVCLGAQVLDVSASPITLPIIAAIVALALPSAPAIGRMLAARGIPDADAQTVRIALEATALLTAGIAVLLALLRPAAGLGTSLTVLAIIGIGAAAAGVVTRQRHHWAVAAASFTGALWSLCALLGATIPEPYLLPPALGAVLVGALLTWRGHPGRTFVGGGLAVGILTVLVALGVDGNEVRLVGLLVASAVLVAAGWLVLRKGPLAGLAVPALGGALLATTAGVVQAVRFGLDLQGAQLGNSAMLAALVLSAIATVLAVAVGVVLAGIRRTRWLYVPALVFAVVGPIVAVREGWFSIVALYLLSLAALGLMVLTVALARSRPTTLPPVWFTFAIAWATAVASWSERDLRVEAYSLPLGLALVAAGALASRPRTGSTATLTTWPIGYRGSWRLLAPGILVILVPSVLATGTDPRTERAVLVIVLALAAILVGSLRKLAAPFVLGIIVLPVENVVVFAGQLGRSIGAAPWWITLATAGAVLLVIAVTSERRSAGSRGVAARLRDLT